MPNQGIDPITGYFSLTVLFKSAAQKRKYLKELEQYYTKHPERQTYGAANL